MATTLIADTITTASAYPTQPEDAFEHCRKYVFIDGGIPWISIEKSKVSEGLEAWEVARTWSGAMVVNVEEVASSGVGVVDARLASLGPFVLGVGNCANNELKFNSSIRTNLPLLEAIARHEGGHVLGLGHTGLDASHNGDNPSAMATPDCQGFSAAEAESFMLDTQYSQDDEAAIINRLGTANPPSLHANQSFERGTKYWGKTAGSWIHHTSGGADGTDYVRWKPTSTADAIYQTLDLSHKSLGSWSLAIDARASHKRWGSLAVGDVKIELLVRRLDFGPLCTAFLSQLDEHERDVISTWTVVKTTGWVPVGGAWDWDTTGTYTVPTGWEGVEVRVRLKSRVKGNGGSGGLVYVRLDNMRARER